MDALMVNSFRVNFSAMETPIDCCVRWHIEMPVEDRGLEDLVVDNGLVAASVVVVLVVALLPGGGGELVAASPCPHSLGRGAWAGRSGRSAHIVPR